MKKAILILIALFFLLGCNSKNKPDVSGIAINIKIGRFDKFLFENTDTVNIARGVASMQSAFPYFTNDFITNILGLHGVTSPKPDSSVANTFSEIKRFIRVTRPLYDSLAPRFVKTDRLEQDLSQGFKYVKYYFPDYKVPQVIMYVGPFDAPGIAITNSALAIGLQLYAGKDFSYYTSMQGQDLFPTYLSRRFEPEYIPASCMKAVAEDLFPDINAPGSLMEQMIRKGREWYLLDKFLPDAPDTLKTGFTAEQLNWCKANEGLIWNFILQGTDIYTTEPSVVKDFIGEAPGTDGMPAMAPGNIGQWIGWQIVKKFASKNADMPLRKLMQTEPGKIFNEARYKPR